jgi:hypothetical protein
MQMDKISFYQEKVSDLLTSLKLSRLPLNSSLPTHPAETSAISQKPKHLIVNPHNPHNPHILPNKIVSLLS